MLLTEEQAKDRWCPMVRKAYPAGSVRSRPDLGPETVEALPQAVVSNRPDDGSCRCIASQCAMWRWFDSLTDDGTQCRLRPSSLVARTLLPDASPLTERRGCCGLAGKPEGV